MICLIALPVLGIMGIFSAKHRKLAKEAFDCVFRKVTFRKCQTNLDQRIKTGITGKLMTKTPKFASFTHKNFEIISLLFVILLITSFYFSAAGLYNYFNYGNCNGPHSDEFCIFNLGDSDLSCGSEHCASDGCNCSDEEIKCTQENNYAACQGDCLCNRDICG